MIGLEKRIFQRKELILFLWLQYLDDIFCIWTQGSQKLNEFFINSQHPTMKFTMGYSTTEINFVNVHVTKVGNKLETDLYCKPTDTHQYLHAQSLKCQKSPKCHRNVYKRSIACGPAVKIKRIRSTEEKLNNCLEELKQWLVNPGHKENHVDSEIERVKLVERTVLFQKQNKKVDDSTTLVLTYHPVLNQVHGILQRNHRHVLNLPRLGSILPSQPRVAFRNPKTIRNKVARSKLKEFIYKDAGANICGHLTVIYVNNLKVEISLKVRLLRKNTALIFHLNVTVAA